MFKYKVLTAEGAEVFQNSFQGVDSINRSGGGWKMRATLLGLTCYIVSGSLPDHLGAKVAVLVRLHVAVVGLGRVWGRGGCRSLLSYIQSTLPAQKGLSDPHSHSAGANTT
ncbi:hypothetical protein CEXT_441341 [Caerostris extrusa]|uniref:Uncharacterized protein n=1 Tax=Caerostris extrusa TaxID=172846 RepID=A0AAV4UIG0_CAEEX|nr:hypothetical protein CEXT_441341 [Caerostris extrusa]